ncbi:hypothetical protein NPIL_211421, partial [Nephila pilipes]
GGVGYYGAAGLSAYCPLATQTLPPGPYSPPDRTKPPIGAIFVIFLYKLKE